MVVQVRSTYYVSANFKDIEGTVKQTGLKQGDLRANLNADLSKAVSLRLSFGSLRQNDMMAGGTHWVVLQVPFQCTALDYAHMKCWRTTLLSTKKLKQRYSVGLNDYVDLADDKTFNASLDLTWKISKFLRYNLSGTGGNINTKWT